MAKTEIKPTWTSSSFLIYTGGLTVLAAAFGGLAYLHSQYHGNGQGTLWTLLYLAILYAVAEAFRRREQPIAAGIFAFAGLIVWTIFVEVFLKWCGFHPTGGSLGHLSWSRLLWLFLILVAAGFDRMRYRFPFLRVVSAVVFPIFVVALLPDGANLTYFWLLIIGIFYLLLGRVSDKPSTFWLHLVSGALIGVSLLHWMHASDADFAVIAIFSLVYVWVADRTQRSSWAVYGTIGFFIVTVHYLVGASGLFGEAFQISHGCPPSSAGPIPGCTAAGPYISAWSIPLGFGLLGFWLVLLGILGMRRRGHVHKAVAPAKTAVVVQTPAPPAAE